MKHEDYHEYSVPAIVRHEDEYTEDCDFSDAVLRFISQMLMEEDVEDKSCMLHESLDLQAAEKSLYEAIGKKYPPLPEECPTFDDERPEGNISGIISSSFSACSHGSKPFLDDSWISSIVSECNTSKSQRDFLVSSAPPQASYYSSNCMSNITDVFQLTKEINKADKFLLKSNDPSLYSDATKLSYQELKQDTTKIRQESRKLVVYEEKNDGGVIGLKEKTNPQRKDVNLEEERNTKQAAVFSEPTIRSEMFDEILLSYEPKTSMLRFSEASEKPTSKSEVRKKGANKSRGRKQKSKEEAVDLRTALISCAQAVAVDDHRSASELLKQIRQHSSPYGDLHQRLAHCFAEALEARLAGTGSQLYKSLVNRRVSAADALKAYQLFCTASPFMKISNFITNATITETALNSMKLHIIDFGIFYGFQWPTFIQRLSSRSGGPPKLRITGIDFPQPGFRPAERVEETGRRLADYAESFNVPFEYNAIAKKWETIQLEELKIDRDETIIVTSLFRFKNLPDDTLVSDSVRNAILDLIRKISPEVFIIGVLNGAYGVPFFLTRFRETLFHYSALFDMLDTTTPREDEVRLLLERSHWGRDTLNVIACEGWERVERPETCKQWQLRLLRAGFRQLPIDKEITRRARERARRNFHKEFLVGENNEWFFQGWKGRILNALSCWKP